MKYTGIEPKESLQKKKQQLISTIRIEIGGAILFLVIFCVDNFENIVQKNLQDLNEIYLLIFGGGMLLSALYFSFQLKNIKRKLLT